MHPCHDYRFPAAVEDSVFATQWVYNNSASIGSDASRLVLAGDSAGVHTLRKYMHTIRTQDITLFSSFLHLYLVYVNAW